MKKILQMTTYPIDKPDHGGKLRSHNIRKVLRKDFDVQTLSFDIQENESIDDLKVILSSQQISKVVGHYYFYDWGINNYLVNTQLKQTIFENVKKFNPDIVLAEQGFLWPLIKEMMAEGILKKDIFIIYSSQNIEYQMKEEIYQDTFDGEELENYVTHVKNMEYDIIRSSDMILAVSNYDKNYIQNIVPQTPVYLYRNGHNGIETDIQKDEWLKKFKSSKRNFVYIASWHGPNINGLYKLVENGLLELDSKEVSIWILGSVGPGLLQTKNIVLEEDSPLKIIGPTESDDIDGAILASTGIVLPIWEGGGSNLKTAQALLSGRKIIASNFAFRGFEEFLDEKELYISDEPKTLIEYMLNMETEYDDIVRDNSINGLLWDNLLSSLSDTINKCHEAKQ